MFFLPYFGFTQNCAGDPSSYIIPENDNVDFVFDSFREYEGGIDQYGSTILKLKVSNNPALICKWKLYVVISNNLWGVATDWNTRATYGSGSAANNPPLDLLKLRITNNCNTPDQTIWNTWKTFGVFPASAVSGDLIYIIDDPIDLNLPGSCSGIQVNSAGSYLTDYSEYTFNIDYSIKPGFSFIPGFYDLKLTFYIAE
jgi:hypothetical protein